ncbi:MAG: hypothetical protein C5B58_15430 [Acidobacteria bacterium]|nr:MAG: hypothetical protein C5B58_15430 [Acidobacteriota bacterium]
MHQVRDWFSGAAAYFGWMRDKAAGPKAAPPGGYNENGPAENFLRSKCKICVEFGVGIELFARWFAWLATVRQQQAPQIRKEVTKPG